MADITAKLTTYLKSRSAITALIGSSTGARVFAERPKQATARPYLVLSQTGGNTITTLNTASGIANASFDLISVADTRAGADALSTAVQGELSADNKTMGATFVTEVVTNLHRDAGDDLPQDGSDSPRYWARSNYTIWFLT